MKALWITDEEMQLLKQQRVKITPEGFMAPDDQSHIECSEPEPDLEFKTCLLHFFNPQSTGDSELIRGQGMHIEKWLNDGWQIDDKIICPPFVMCVLSREKEAPE
jgi:hypothetical protein